MEKEKMKETLQAYVEKEAWRVISKNAKLTPEMIGFFNNKIDWELLSENESMRWTVGFVFKKKERINWTSLSASLFREEETLDCTEHLEIVRKFSKLLDWKVLSGLHLPTRKEYLKEFTDCWDWETITENIAINWDDALIDEYEDKLLPVLGNIVLENLVDGNGKNFVCGSGRRSRRTYTNLLEQLIEKNADKLKAKLLYSYFEHEFEEDDRTLKITGNKTVEDIINQYFD